MCSVRVLYVCACDETYEITLPFSPHIRRRMLWNDGVRNEPLPICFCYYVQTINDLITTYVQGWLETRWCRTLTAVPFDPFHMLVVFVEQYIAWNGKKKNVSTLYLRWTGNISVENTILNDETDTYLRVTGSSKDQNPISIENVRRFRRCTPHRNIFLLYIFQNSHAVNGELG